MLAFYAQIKWVHIAAVLASGGVFALRGLLFHLGAGRVAMAWPLRFLSYGVGRFVSQPRLRLAWLIAYGRSCFWSTFFVYGSLLMIEGNLGKEASGLLISLSQLGLCMAYLAGKISERAGVRKVIAGAYAVAALAVIGTGYAGTSQPVLAAVFLLVGATANSALDGVGGIPYLRSVRAHERPQMTLMQQGRSGLWP